MSWCSTNNISKQPSETGDIERKSSSSPGIIESCGYRITKSDENSHENVLKKHIKRNKDSGAVELKKVYFIDMTMLLIMKTNLSCCVSIRFIRSHLKWK